MFSFFEKLINPFPSEPSSCPPDRVIAFCWHYLKGIWPLLILTSILVAVVSAMEVMLFGFLGSIVDWLATAERETFLQQEGTTLLWMALVIVVLIPLGSALHSLLLHQTVMGNTPMIIRWLGHRYLLGQSYAFYQDEFAGRISTKLLQTANAVRDTALKFLDVLVYVGVYFIGALILVASFDFWLLVPFLVWLLLYIALLKSVLPQLAAASKKFADKNSIMTGRMVDSYTNIMTVKLFAHAGREEAYARDGMQGMLGALHKMMRNLTVMGIGLNIINGFLLFSVGAIAIWSWLEGNSSVGAVAVSTGLVLRMTGMSHWIMWEMSSLFENIGTVKDGIKVLSLPQSVQDKEAAQALTVTLGEIDIKQICFHYGKGSGVIENLSLSIQAGEKVGLVGHSGSGKTTLMNLLLRLYDLEAGQILIDGQDISLVSQNSLRQQIGVVTQDSSLLHRSVAENIAYGCNDASMDDIIKAAKRANAHEFILGLEDKEGRTGYAAQVGERGVKLSGGQRQRISIARMFLKDAPILILDEATSALDSEVESAIQEHLYDLMQGKTVISIAHRLSTIAAMDRLVVLEKGALKEQGSHDQLLQLNGTYANLWKHQSGGFIAE
ncbi:ABC transporter ATP-binding protein [Thiomicrorhabdus sp. 6S2-11]|uniref:ABC transporter ATP-binding protein n=1 Tax=Thiomicrorhabdus marina TaxID=2818442 RepID=A0ABS3Q5A3_9GAMM|nr:ABC transporter ATP-binding protein [Thiomicrorhabdus marina]MBO1927456.1 ABC transporter ATP-binding protein [Thiomicrorhabdus marina]